MSATNTPFSELKGTESRRELQVIAKRNPDLFGEIKLAGKGATTAQIAHAMSNRIQEHNQALIPNTREPESVCQVQNCVQCLELKVNDLEWRAYYIEQGLWRLRECCCVSGTLIAIIILITFILLIRL